MKNKLILFLLSSFTLTLTKAQQLNIGVVGAGSISDYYSNTYTAGLAAEYRPQNSFLSFNTELNVLFSKGFTTFSQPIYLKIQIGDKFKFGGSFGGFYRVSQSWGLLAGVNLDYCLNEKYILFTKFDYYRENYWEIVYSHWGTSDKIIGTNNSFWINLGVKRALYFKK
jgi:hypothetical protein